MVASGRRWGPWGCPVAPCLQDQNSSAAQVRVIWRCGVPDSTTTSTPRRSPSLVASTKLSSLSDDFDAALDREDSATGTPQGGILSPLLANIALSALDEHLHAPWRPGGDMSTGSR